MVGLPLNFINAVYVIRAPLFHTPGTVEIYPNAVFWNRGDLPLE